MCDRTKNYELYIAARAHESRLTDIHYIYIFRATPSVTVSDSDSVPSAACTDTLMHALIPWCMHAHSYIGSMACHWPMAPCMTPCSACKLQCMKNPVQNKQIINNKNPFLCGSATEIISCTTNFQYDINWRRKFVRLSQKMQIYQRNVKHFFMNWPSAILNPPRSHDLGWKVNCTEHSSWLYYRVSLKQHVMQYLNNSNCGRVALDTAPPRSVILSPSLTSWDNI
jgi:hypothetical protein